MQCSQCAGANGDASRFCSNCGASLSANRPPATAPVRDSLPADGERRHLTVMFCDVVDSTALSTQYDPEDLREIIRSFQDVCVGVVKRYEGFVAQHLGDGLLIYFGYPIAHENNSERAVHAGLGIIEAMGGLEPRPGLRLKVRVGIATGPIVIGELVSAGANVEKVAVGQTPNLAARLQSLAAPNTVVISPHTHRMLGQGFECREIGIHTLKGIAVPVLVREVIRQSERKSRFDAAHGMSVMPLVGRYEEMALLQARLQQAAAGQGQVVLLSGEAGIGKSRITRAVVESACFQHRMELIELQCSPYYNQSALFPVIEWLQEKIFSSADAADAGWEVLDRFLDKTTLDKKQAAPLLAMLLSIPAPADRPALNLTPDRHKQLTLQYLAELFRQLSPSPMVLVVVEDLHWADPSTLELIRVWMEESAADPSLLLLTSRPEFAPPWPAQDNFTMLDIGRLADAQSMELVRLAAGDASLSDSMLRQLMKKSDNVPLYLEVLTKQTVLTNQESAGKGLTSERPEMLDNEIPESLQDALMARLDRMNNAKSVAQLAAILGREFDGKMLEAVWTGTRESLYFGLEQLCKADLLQVRGDFTKGLYQFKHALIRDAAYDSMLKRSCESLHRQVADVMERVFPEVALRQPEVLAHHYTAGKEMDPAVRYWLAAGQLALKGFATQESVAHLNEGLALLAKLPAAPERDVKELEFRILLGHCLMTWKGYGADDVRVTCARAHELCGLVGNAPQLPIALYQLVAYNIVSGNLETALGLAKQLYAIAAHINNDDLLVEAYLTLGVIYFHRGEFSEAVPYLEKCLATYHPQRHALHMFQFGQDPAVVANNFLVWIHWLMGRQAQALRSADAAISLARRLGHPLSLAFALAFAGWHRIFCRDYAAAAPIREELVEFCGVQKILIFLAHGHMMASWQACDQGHTTSGLLEMRSATDLFRMTGAKHLLPWWEGHYATMGATAGNMAEAEASLVRCLEATERTGERWSEAELHRYRGMLLEKSGKPFAQAEACYRQAIAVAQRQGAVAWELRATINLASSLIAQEAREPARELIEALLDRASLDLDQASGEHIKALLAACGDATAVATP
jgi:class 3 adenylate cyclase/tetratricopeptide (TPR) repeat protein